MQQSLVTRFQGALVGMYVARQAQLAPAESNVDSDPRRAFKNYALLVGASIDSILHCRNVNIEDWLASVSRLISDDQLPIAILPIALYLHEDVPRLQETVQQIGDRYQLDPESMASLLFFATGIAALLAESCPPAAFIPHMLAAQPSTTTAVANQLQLIHDRVIVNATLPNIAQLIGAIVAQEQPYLWPIAMASYCFLSTPQHFRLSVDRAAHIPNQPPLTIALTGILLGAANGTTKIPLSWCANDDHAAAQLMQLAEKLWDMWAGVYQPGMRLASKSQVVAAPAVIQKRL